MKKKEKNRKVEKKKFEIFFLKRKKNKKKGKVREKKYELLL